MKPASVLPSTEPQPSPPSRSGAHLSKDEAIAQATLIHGWMVEEELSWLYDQATQMQTIVEIGSWLGRSTTVLCHACPGTVYAVDHWRPEDPEILNIIRKGFYAPAAFKLQMKPFLDSGKLILLQENSLRASRDAIIPQHPDMVFIDAEHDLVNMRRDLFLWAKRARHLICGHDYYIPDPDPKYKMPHIGYPDVKKGVDEYFQGKHQLVGASTIWAVWKMRGLSC